MRGNLKALTVAAALVITGTASAQDDSSANAAAGYPAAVVDSDAVVIRVPVDANGVELRDRAELRLTKAADQGAELEAAFAEGVAVVKEAVLDANSDSSTSRWGNCGWNNWGGYNGNYYSYQPSYSYYQSSWSYSYSYSYSSYNSYSYNYGGYNSHYNRSNYYYYQPYQRSYYGNSGYGWGHGW